MLEKGVLLLPDNDDIENMPVYPIIHMIRQVSCYDFSAFRCLILIVIFRICWQVDPLSIS